MFRLLSNLFRKEGMHKEPFADEVLGPFIFDSDLGWKKQIMLGNREIELVLGSNGEPPSDEMIATARSWVSQWPIQHPRVIDHIRAQFLPRADRPGIPVPDQLKVESINILWRDKPKMSMIYLYAPGDDIRAWHVTFDGFEPKGIGCDD